MKRTYAFEADASAEVKDELEKVETVVDEKCESVEDCEKLEEKIEKVEDKFNDALQGMADAAKEGGDKEELKEKIDPHMADLKEIAKDIGVATESEVVTDQELKDVKNYIEGAKEIVEAKKDELEGNCDGKDCDDEGEGDDESEEDAKESFRGILEGYSYNTNDEFALACESDIAACMIAMEGYNWDKRKDYKANVKAVKAMVKEAKNLAKKGDKSAAAAKMNEAVKKLEEFKADFIKECKENQGVGNAIIGYFAYALRGMGMSLAVMLPTMGLGSMVVGLKHDIEFIVDVTQAIANRKQLTPSDFNMYTKSMEHNMDLMISRYKDVAKKFASGNYNPNGDGDGKSATESFIATLESMMITKSKANKGPYMFE